MIEQTPTANSRESDLISYDEATALCDVDRTLLRKLVRTSAVKGTGRGQSARISKSGLLAYLKTNPIVEQLRLF